MHLAGRRIICKVVYAYILGEKQELGYLTTRYVRPRCLDQAYLPSLFSCYIRILKDLFIIFKNLFDSESMQAGGRAKEEKQTPG